MSQPNLLQESSLTRTKVCVKYIEYYLAVEDSGHITRNEDFYYWLKKTQNNTELKIKKPFSPQTKKEQTYSST